MRRSRRKASAAAAPVSAMDGRTPAPDDDNDNDNDGRGSVRSVRSVRWHFTLDDVVNPVLLPSPARRLPRVVSRFLGFRDGPETPVGTLVTLFWTFVGVFAAVAAAGVTVGHLPAVQAQYHRNIVLEQPARNPVFSVGIFGAAAVLEFYALDSPYAQPRSVVGGQLVSSVVGVAVAKLAAAADPDPVRRASRRWLTGALATAVASCLMAATGTVHPPGGATALLATTDNGALAVGWLLVPCVLAGSVVMQAVALVVNNVQRRYPLYFWTPEETGQLWKGLARHGRRWWRRWRRRRRRRAEAARRTSSRASDPERAADEVKPAPEDDTTTAPSPSGTHDRTTGEETLPIDDGESTEDDTASDADAAIDRYPTVRTLSSTTSQRRRSGASPPPPAGRTARHSGPALIITHNSVLVPETLALLPDEVLFLEALSQRL